jgi:sulfane dehydrogenase subunit SoxC
MRADELRGAPTQANPTSRGYNQLRALPSVEIPAFIERANGRSFFASQQATPIAGTQWGLGAIGVAKWRGVPLAEVLERARILPGAVDVMPSIKWVGQIQVSKEPLYSSWNTPSYILEGPDYPTPIPLTTQVVNSAFELAFNATLPNASQFLTGRSWSAIAPIKRVDISTDGGASWRPARL